MGGDVLGVRNFLGCCGGSDRLGGAEMTEVLTYEALKAERDALADRVNGLAVENAGFKHALSVILEHVDVTDKGPAGVVAMIANDELFNSETPATDAALAAIQAQGVEKYAADLDLIASESNPAEPKHTVASSYADSARSFAKKLREAK